MATTDSKVLPSSKRRPLAACYSPYFQDATASTAGAVPSPWPLSAADFTDIQLRELAQLYDRLNRLYRQFNPLIEACLAGTVLIDVLTTACLVRLRGEVHELTGHAEQVTVSNYQRWMQVKRRRQPEERN